MLEAAASWKTYKPLGATNDLHNQHPLKELSQRLFQKSAMHEWPQNPKLKDLTYLFSGKVHDHVGHPQDRLNLRVPQWPRPASSSFTCSMFQHCGSQHVEKGAPAARETIARSSQVASGQLQTAPAPAIRWGRVVADSVGGKYPWHPPSRGHQLQKKHMTRPKIPREKNKIILTWS